MSLSLGIFLDLEGDLWLTSWPSVLMKISEERFDCLLAWLWLDLGRKLSSAVVAQGDWRPYQGSANCAGVCPFFTCNTRHLEFRPRKVFEGVQSHVLELLRKCNFGSLHFSSKWIKVADWNSFEGDQKFWPKIAIWQVIKNSRVKLQLWSIFPLSESATLVHFGDKFMATCKIGGL